MNLGAGFFGWLVAIAMTILLISVVGAMRLRRPLNERSTKPSLEGTSRERCPSSTARL